MYIGQFMNFAIENKRNQWCIKLDNETIHAGLSCVDKSKLVLGNKNRHIFLSYFPTRKYLIYGMPYHMTAKLSPNY